MTDDQALDRLLDALNAGRLDPAAIDDPELAELLTLARELRQLGPSAPTPEPGWPATDFPQRLAQRLAAALRPAPRPLPAPPDFGDAAPHISALNGRASVDDELAVVAGRGAARRWLREGLRLAAAGVALALLTGLLVALLHDRGGQTAHIGSSNPLADPSVLMPPAAQNHLLGTPSAGGGTPPAGRLSIWAFDPDAAEAHQHGLGQPLQLSQQAGGYTVTLEWAYSDGRQIYLVYRISAPPGQTYNSFNLWSAKLTDSAGTILLARGGGGTAVVDGTGEMLTRFDAGQAVRQGGTLKLHFSAPALQAIVPNPAAATPTAI
ncbi:MAG TPA: DUF4179 domain-containing protein, partial [Thermomicrobiaceae bacterium]|nr:DUF4179 domain-containing protein [Thermomicrobiaceae bacterium]